MAVCVDVLAVDDGVADVIDDIDVVDDDAVGNIAVGNTDVSPTDDAANGDSWVSFGVKTEVVLDELDKDDTNPARVCSKFFTFTDNL